MPKHYNFIILGGGSAGYAAARTAADARASVAIIDGADNLGGLCILRGCMPSKTLIYSAEVAHLAKQGKALGLNVPAATVDMPALQERKQRLVDGFAQYRLEQLHSERFDLYRQYARFKDPHTVELSDQTLLQADKFIISTGSTVQVPDLRGLKETPFLTSDEVLNLDSIPKSVIVLGGGVIACELAQFLLRAGSRVTLIQRSPHILKEASPEAASVLEQALRDEGCTLYTHTRIQNVNPTDEGGVQVTFTQGEDSPISVQAAVLFNALGRKPNTDRLNLQAAKVLTLPSGHIKTNDYQQTTNPNIYAAGDCCGPHEIVHIAVLQGEIATKHSLNAPVNPLNYNHLTKIIFTDPQIAQIGLTEGDLQRSNVSYLSASHPFNDHGKSNLMDANYGYVKVFSTTRDALVVGAECVGKDASELIHSMAVAITLKATVHDMLQVHWYHPTLSEIWTYPLEELAANIPPETTLCL